MPFLTSCAREARLARARRQAPRRALLIGSAAVAISAAFPALGGLGAAPAIDGEVAAMEAKLGGRIGIAALDTGNGARIAHRASERFAMASTFKWLLAAFILTKIDRGDITLDQQIPYGDGDLLPHAPVTAAHARQGRLGVAELVAAAVEISDNGAANLLLRLCGGPAKLTEFLRSIGDPMTRLDRVEMSLNTNLPGDPRDTTTPDAMVGTMQRILLGDVLSVMGRDRLIGWLKDCSTGRDRLRAGFPGNWVAGDKTGTGENGAVNDLAIAWPPARAPILIACYMSGSKAPIEKLSAAHARIGAMVAARFG